MSNRQKYIGRIKLAVFAALILGYEILYRLYGHGSYVWRIVPLFCLFFVPSVLNLYSSTTMLKKLGINSKYLWYSNLFFVLNLVFNLAILTLFSVLYDVYNIDSIAWQIGIVAIFFVSYLLTSMLIEIAILVPLRKKYNIKINPSGNPINPENINKKSKPDVWDIFE
ncbi:MAG: hypothetical protein FWF56_05005 [Firmicutes bacterium]|nr:hypothetical protein [Bacillota bacterium]MCL1953554.1 hypothetical protein [Bacillota bacterium]